MANEALSSGQLVSAGFMLEVHEVHGKDPRYSLLLLIFIDIPHKSSIPLFPYYKLTKRSLVASRILQSGIRLTEKTCRKKV